MKMDHIKGKNPQQFSSNESATGHQWPSLQRIMRQRISYVLTTLTVPANGSVKNCNDDPLLSVACCATFLLSSFPLLLLLSIRPIT